MTSPLIKNHREPQDSGRKSPEEECAQIPLRGPKFFATFLSNSVFCRFDVRKMLPDTFRKVLGTGWGLPCLSFPCSFRAETFPKKIPCRTLKVLVREGKIAQQKQSNPREEKNKQCLPKKHGKERQNSEPNSHLSNSAIAMDALSTPK